MNSLLVKINSNDNDKYDAMVVLSLDNADAASDVELKHLEVINTHKRYDETVEKEGCLIVLPGSVNRLVYSPIGPLNRDYDDVRRIFDAAYRGVKRALCAGAKEILLVFPNFDKARLEPVFSYADGVAFLGALHALYVPLEIRESLPNKAAKVNFIGFHKKTDNDFKEVTAIELGITIARDIGGSDPERMSPMKVADYVSKQFSNSKLKIEIISDEKQLNEMFPLFSAVNRGSSEKHRGRVIIFTYEPENASAIEKTLCLVGKGVCYDTGGHDLKVNGIMQGMHRDKCGAAAVAGFMKTVEMLQPKNVRVIGAMAMVRNSIGPDAYVSDEIVTARSGKRIRIVNTDAEGRMAMGDVLCYMKEQVIAKNYVNPSIMTIATLTGHAVLAVGEGYSAIMSNGPAKKAGIPTLLQNSGDKIGDIFEISTIRREDYAMNKGKSEYEDLMQSNVLPSSRSQRGHQFPAAFLIQASGLDKHGLDSDRPLCYSHIDIAPSSGPFPGVPTGAPIPALTLAYLL